MGFEDKLEKLHEELEAVSTEAAKLYNDNAPKFGRGIAEASMERSSALLNDVKAVFDKHNIVCTFNARVVSDLQHSKDGLPIVVFGGVMVEMQARVMALDEEGKHTVPDEVHVKLVKLENDMREKENKINKLVQKMRGVKR